jgi:TRAP-type mannitol/chloroaromatic compound transport system permease small subunit
LRWYRFVIKALVATGAVCAFVLMIYLTIDVAGRYLANRPMPAAFELARTMMVLLVFLSFAYAQERKKHMRLDIVTERLGARGKALFDLFAYCIGFFVFVLITWQIGRWAWESWLSKEYMDGAVQIPFYPIKFIAVLGSFFLSVQYVIDIIKSSVLFLSAGVKEPKS